MVLVDLSEAVVMCMTVVTDELLDIFGALALLLKEDGSIVKIKLYPKGFSEIFEYTRTIFPLSAVLGHWCWKAMEMTT